MMDGVERSMHDLSHLSFLSGEVGRLTTISVVPVLPGDGAEFDVVGAVRLSPLRRGLAMDSVVDVLSFYVPHRHVYGTDWIDFIEQGWDESVTLATEDYGATQDLGCLALGTFASVPIPKFYPEGYRNIWNNYFRPPTTVSEETRLVSAWTATEREFGLRCANLKTLWTALLANNVTSSDYNVSAAGSVVSLLDIDAQRGYLRTEQEREFFDIRYRDIVSDRGGFTSIDVDNRPQLLMRSTFWASGYDVDGTSETSLGQFSGRVQQSFRHRVPRFHCGEHGAIWTVAVLRFPVVHEEESHFLANNPQFTYSQVAGDPSIVSTQPPYGLRVSDVFGTSSDNTVRGYIPFGQWYRYHPSFVHPRFDALNGFPFLETVPGSLNDMVLCTITDYDDVFQTTQLGHYQIHSRVNCKVARRLPSSASSLLAGR